MGKAISRCFLLSQPSFSELEVVQKTVVVGHVGEQQGNFIWKAQHVSPFFIHLFRTKATAATAIICYCYLLHIKQRVIQMLYFLCNLDKIFLFYYFGYYFESNFLHFAPSCSATLQCLKNTGKSLIFQVMRHFQVILLHSVCQQKVYHYDCFPFVWFVPKMYFDGLVGIGPIAAKLQIDAFFPLKSAFYDFLMCSKTKVRKKQI